jgi:hypothetical protein
MSNYLKSGDFIGGAQYLNKVADSVANGQPDAMGLLPGAYAGGGLTIGDYLRLNNAEALALSDTTVGTLYGGVYRRVLLKAGITGGGNTGFKRGQIVFWDSPLITSGADQYQVTNVEATDADLIAGIIINATDTATLPLSGKYVWIQTAGVAMVQYRASVTAKTQFVDVIWGKLGAGADNGTADALALATAITGTFLVSYIGIAVITPTDGGITAVQLVGLNDRNI